MTPTAHRGPRHEHYQRILLDGTETRASLLGRGLPYRSVTRALKYGWYTRHYHQPQYPQEAGPGAFTQLQNPYAFATAQVQHVFRERACRLEAYEAFEDGSCWVSGSYTHMGV